MTVQSTPREHDAAIRHHYPVGHEHERDVDDVFVRGVELFRMEQLSSREFWICCYLEGGDRITWHVHVDRAGTRKGLIQAQTTEAPQGLDWEPGSEPRC